MNGPAALTSVAGMVEDRLRRLLAEERDRWVSVDAGLADPFGILSSYLLPGGKRLRPAFCYWSFSGCGGDPEDPAVIDVAAGLEMFHAAALIHDDFVDRSERRRGSPTAHVELAGRHREQRWSGDSEHFGNGTAVVVGDLALAYSNRLLARAAPEARHLFDEMQVEVDLGQFLDIVGAAKGLGSDGAEERARIIRLYKTAKYTVERPMHLGAALADPPGLADVKSAVSQFALPLGEAFQLTDDVLGVFGDPTVTGKPVGDDLREGKLTLLTVLAAGRGTDLTNPAEAGAIRSEVEDRVAVLLDQAEEARRRLPFNENALLALGELAAFIGARNR